MTIIKRFAERRVLLAIGNSTYPNGPGPLFTSENSAQELAKLLREWGEFELCRGEIHTNVERPRMQELLQATFGIKEEYETAAETAVFYFSGHGTDTRTEHGEMLAGFWFVTNENECLSAADVLGLVEKSPAQHILLILDCCHAGGLIARLGELHGCMLAGKNDVIIFASSEWNERGREIGGAPGSFFAADLIASAYLVEPDGKGFVTPGRWWERFYEEWAWSQENNPQRKPRETDPQKPRKLGYEGHFSLFYVGCGEEKAKRIANMPPEFRRRRQQRLSNIDLPRPLISGREPLSDQPHPADLLRAGAELIPFFGRDKELEWLNTWLKRPDNGGVALLFAQGGEGKTRLALEWCTRLRRDGIVAGFVPRSFGATDDDRLEQMSQLRNLLDNETADPLVLVYDYAETRIDNVKWILGKLRETKRPVRVLLLARAKGEWFDRLGKDDVFVEDLIAGAIVSQVRPDPSWDRRQMFEAACDEYARRLNKNRPLTKDISLSLDWFSQPLFLGMAALAAVDERKIGDMDNVLSKSVAHERRYWRGAVSVLVPGDTILQEMLVDTMERAVALITLWGGVSLDEAESVITRVSTLSANKSHLICGIVALLDGFYGRDFDNGRRVSGLEPDLLGEELVCQLLEKDSRLLEFVFNDSKKINHEKSLTVLTRISQRKPDEVKWLKLALNRRLGELIPAAINVALNTKGAIVPVLVELLKNSGNYSKDILIEVHNSIPKDTIILLPLALTVTESLLTISHERGADHAQILDSYSRILCQYESSKAIRHAEKAVSIWKTISSEKPDFLVKYAEALANLAEYRVHFDEQHPYKVNQQGTVVLGRKNKIVEYRNCPSVEYADLAISIGNELAFSHSLHSTKVLASAHKARSVCLFSDRDNGKHLDDALQSIECSIKYYRALMEDNNEQYCGNLVAALLQRADILLEHECYEEALNAIAEASIESKILADIEKDSFLKFIIQIQVTTGRILRCKNREDSAYLIIKEALGLAQSISVTNEDFSLPFRLLVLPHYQDILQSLNRHDEAKAVSEEMALIRTKLEKLNGDRTNEIEWDESHIAYYPDEDLISEQDIGSEYIMQTSESNNLTNEKDYENYSIQYSDTSESENCILPDLKLHRPPKSTLGPKTGAWINAMFDSMIDSEAEDAFGGDVELDELYEQYRVEHGISHEENNGETRSMRQQDDDGDDIPF